MRYRIILLGIVVLLGCSSPKDRPQMLRQQLIGHWIEDPKGSFPLGLTEFTITDSTLSFANQPDSLAARYEISPMDSLTLFLTSNDIVTLKVVLSENSDTLKLIGGKAGRSLSFVREE